MIPLKTNVKNATFPFVNWFITLMNCYVFSLELRLNDIQLQHFVNHWALIPVHLFTNIRVYGYTLFSAAFLHAGWMHIGSNMLFLHIFGDNVEDNLGHFKYFLFYFLVAALANGTQALLSSHSTLPLLGASGAIAGVLGFYFFYYPYAKVMTLIPLFFFITIREIPAFFFLGVWFILQTINGTLALSSQLISKQSMGGVAWWAHASGFIYGLLLAPALGQRKGKFR
jgi:membrane associated rhomboid family serine protease